MNVVLTGATGFIGQKLLNISCENFDVLALTRKALPERKHKIFSELFDVTVSDLNNAEVFIHLAGIAHSPLSCDADYELYNTKLTLFLAQTAVKANIKRFVFVSSIGVNGTSTQKKAFSSIESVSPHNAYSQSKYDAEIGLKKIAQESGLELVIVRPTLVYGPNAPGNFGLLTKLVQKLPFLPFGLADNKCDFIAVHNLADFLLTCAKHPDAAGHTFLASDGETVSIKGFTNLIARGLNKSIVQLPIPTCLLRLAARVIGKSSMAEQLLGNLQVDSSNALEVLGWVPPYTMEQAMASLSESKK
ncbi:NAD-dependent epimerase/dehydratase family protein [Shewanella sp. 202IG2-18]|uniref:NAD-dependent epimerase/dehydratase family protein n=1 Tax=Parashewanella hymeniacidonis TaxID=2807618 RepID=UPI0019600C3D|nr:NAD-dependent epimerase/dehydratase family protein [Parashewanella hymeniacidonis]MBM7072107.1 NAD-dependent epimerase/dehydratase family protein [Parashewanella hymeniacidonis]